MVQFSTEFRPKHLFRQYYQQPVLTFMLFITMRPSEFRLSLSWPWHGIRGSFHFCDGMVQVSSECRGGPAEKCVPPILSTICAHFRPNLSSPVAWVPELFSLLGYRHLPGRGRDLGFGKNANRGVGPPSPPITGIRCLQVVLDSFGPEKNTWNKSVERNQQHKHTSVGGPGVWPWVCALHFIQRNK
jgi:hypothetical protein